MLDKKKISIIALDPRAGESYRAGIASLFADAADVSAFSVLDGSAAGVLERADLFVASTGAYGSPEELMRHIPIDSQTMAREAIAQLEQFGVTHIHWIPLLSRRAGGPGRSHRRDAGRAALRPALCRNCH